MKPFGIVSFICLILVWGTLGILSGCGDSRPPMPSGATTPATPSVYSNRAGQSVETVLVSEWIDWLETHKNCEIVSITSFSGRLDSSNPTTSFIVVYRKSQ